MKKKSGTPDCIQYIIINCFFVSNFYKIFGKALIPLVKIMLKKGNYCELLKIPVLTADGP